MSANLGSTTMRNIPDVACLADVQFGWSPITASRATSAAPAWRRPCGRVLPRWSISRRPPTAARVWVHQPRPLRHRQGSRATPRPSMTSRPATTPTAQQPEHVLCRARLRPLHRLGHPCREQPDRRPAGAPRRAAGSAGNCARLRWPLGRPLQPGHPNLFSDQRGRCSAKLDSGKLPVLAECHACRRHARRRRPGRDRHRHADLRRQQSGGGELSGAANVYQPEPWFRPEPANHPERGRAAADYRATRQRCRARRSQRDVCRGDGQQWIPAPSSGSRTTGCT